MMATARVYRLRAHRLRLRREQAEEARQRVLALDVPPPIQDEMLSVIEGWSPSRSGWTFVMLSPAQNASVVKWLMDNSEMPRLAVVLWATCFEFQRRGTNEIKASRRELAESVGGNPRDVSRIMSELVGIGAIIRSYEGRRVSYRMNDQVATKLSGKRRDRAQAASPPLVFEPRPKRKRKPRTKVSHLSLVPPAE